MTSPSKISCRGNWQLSRLLTGSEAFAVELSSAPRRVATAALLPIAMAAVYKPGYYHDYAEVCALMEMWAEKYPGYTDLESVRTMTSPLGGP